MADPPTDTPAHDPPPRADLDHDRGLLTNLVLLVRCVVGGVLMGVANLVPGVSGGTMLLATGIYPRFVQAVADLSTLRIRRGSLVVLGVVVVAAAVAFVLAAGVIRPLVIEHRWVMYSIFIGLTLGGVPILWRMLQPVSRRACIAAAVGFLLMAGLAISQATGWGAGDGDAASWPMMFVAGVAGASAMILPGISGAYLFLVLDVYLPILGGLDDLRVAISEGDHQTIIHLGLTLVLPVGMGVVVGVVAVSNIVSLLLRRFRQVTLGVLMGLLLGAVVGLWPFQEGVEPAVGDVVRGQVMTEQRIAELDPERYPTQFFTPTATQAAAAAGLLLGGFLITATLSHFSNRRPDHDNARD